MIMTPDFQPKGGGTAPNQKPANKGLAHVPRDQKKLRKTDLAIQVATLKIKGFSVTQIAQHLKLSRTHVQYLYQEARRLYRIDEMLHRILEEGGRAMLGEQILLNSRERTQALWLIHSDEDVPAKTRVAALVALRMEEEHVVHRLIEVGIIPKQPETLLLGKLTATPTPPIDYTPEQLAAGIRRLAADVGPTTPVS